MIRLTVLAAVLLVAFLRPGHADEDPPPVRSEDLQLLIEGKGDWNQLSVMYSDMHAIHGGLTLTIHGDGTVEQEARRMKIGETKAVSREALVELVQLLMKYEAWEQRAPERPPIPDESRAWLGIALGKRGSIIWEWYNDMRWTDRILEIRELMKRIAWKSPP